MWYCAGYPSRWLGFDPPTHLKTDPLKKCKAYYKNRKKCCDKT